MWRLLVLLENPACKHKHSNSTLLFVLHHFNAIWNFEGSEIWLWFYFWAIYFWSRDFWGFHFFNFSIIPTTWNWELPPPHPRANTYTTEDRKQLYWLQNAIVGKLPKREWIKTEKKHLNNPGNKQKGPDKHNYRNVITGVTENCSVFQFLKVH